MFFVQMSGFPGSGKSTLAKEIAKQTGAVIVDHDVAKSALLESINATPLDNKYAGKISYHIDWALIEFYLSLGHSVIFDSPCLYEELVERGLELTNKYEVKYKYVECFLEDMVEVNQRLRNRSSLISQVKEIQSEKAFKQTLCNSKKPSGYKCIKVNTAQPIEDYLQTVINYIHD